MQKLKVNNFHTDLFLDLSESLDLALDRLDLADPRDFAESLDLALDRLDLVDRRDFPESLDLLELLDLALDFLETFDLTEIRDLAESLPLSPNPQPFPNLGVSVRSITSSFLTGLASRESKRRVVRDLRLPRESVLSLLDLVDLEDLIGLKSEKNVKTVNILF